MSLLRSFFGHFYGLLCLSALSVCGVLDAPDAVFATTHENRLILVRRGNFLYAGSMTAMAVLPASCMLSHYCSLAVRTY